MEQRGWWGGGLIQGCVTHPGVWVSKEPSLLSMIDSGIDLVTAGEMKKLEEEAQESSRTTESPEVLQNVSLPRSGQELTS